MRKFVFYLTNTGKSKYGGIYEFATIYEIKRNGLVAVGQTRKWCTASYMGSLGEVNAYLLEHKVIPRTWSRDYDGSLTSYYKINEKYEIKEI